MKCAYVALGSNLGNRGLYISRAMEALRALPKTDLCDTSHLYETYPMHITDQPNFFNAAVKIQTALPPHTLLQMLKDTEKRVGRTAGVQFGPRVLDLDILFYGNEVVETDGLVIPHPRLHTREFVLSPLMDMCSELRHPRLGESVSSLYDSLLTDLYGPRPAAKSQFNQRQNHVHPASTIKRIMPLVGDRSWRWGSKTHCMGVLNVTPDSFSDGGRFVKIENAVRHARMLWKHGADVLDVGGQSTRPGAELVSEQEEMDRVVPVVSAVLEDNPNAVISVDTFYAKVAAEAVRAGAAMINDVTAGEHDPNMMTTVARLAVPYTYMHMRGTPKTMQNPENLCYSNLVPEVHEYLRERGEKAIQLGIPRWHLLCDPGIGFAKTHHQNLELLRNVSQCVPLGLPVLVGLSRKGFIGTVLTDKDLLFGSSNTSGSESRLWGTAGAVAMCAAQGTDMVRVHDLPSIPQLLGTCDAISRR